MTLTDRDNLNAVHPLADRLREQAKALRGVVVDLTGLESTAADSIGEVSDQASSDVEDVAESLEALAVEIGGPAVGLPASGLVRSTHRIYWDTDGVGPERDRRFRALVPRWLR